ncbi:MAG: hypothetical protein H0S80_07690 [Desulfovibrionaceae bacterium]|nr:hypothetical protein [Desulfovibrionaceae bacterium]
MGSIVALNEFRRTLGARDKRPAGPARPAIRGSEIWGRDYTQLEAVVFGLLKVRDIAAHHAGRRDAPFDQLCLDALDAAYRATDVGKSGLKAAIKPLKEALLDMMTEDNKRDVSWALVLCDLIEKSPFR